MSDVVMIVSLSLLGSIFALIGGVIFLYIPKWSQILSRYSVPFAAGVLLTVALVGILPEAVHGAGEVAYAVALLSFIAAYVFEHYAFNLHHHEHHHHHMDKGPIVLVIVGDTIHNFIDGVAIATSFLINPGLGIITSVSTFLHEVPHEIGDFGILLKAGWQRSHIFLVNLLSASFSILGALFVLFVIPSDYLLGLLLAIAAGLFLYLGSSDFLPHADEGLTKNKAITSLLLGTCIMLSIFWLIPHSHSEDDYHQEVSFDRDEHLIEESNTDSTDTSEQKFPSVYEKIEEDEVQDLQGYL